MRKLDLRFCSGLLKSAIAGTCSKIRAKRIPSPGGLSASGGEGMKGRGKSKQEMEDDTRSL